MVGFWNIWPNSLNFFWFQAVNILTGSLSAIAVDRFLLMFHLRKKVITPRCKAYLTLIWLTTITFIRLSLKFIKSKLKILQKFVTQTSTVFRPFKCISFSFCSFRSHALSSNGHWHETLV